MYGRAGDLAKLNKDRNDPRLPNIVRLRADRAHATIVEQMKDKKLMRLREQLINAVLAGDQDAQIKIEVAMRAHTHQDQETGL